MASDQVRLATVGRSQELADVATFVCGVAGGQGQGLLVEGEPGIGKSHLLDELIESAREHGLGVLHARARELEQDVPFATILEALGSGASGWATMRAVEGPAEAVVVRMFGALEVRLADSRIGARDFGGVKPKQLLEVLLQQRGRAVAKDRIAESLWGEELPA